VEYACGLTEHMKGEFSSQVADGVDVHSVREPSVSWPRSRRSTSRSWCPVDDRERDRDRQRRDLEAVRAPDPSVSVRLGELLREGGLPKGVFNVIHGNADTVNNSSSTRASTR